MRLLVLAACLLVLAGCTGRAPHHAAPPPPPAAQPQANYKVGNPYQINGVWYYPAENFGYDETGIASWYGADFHGKYTANGEVFDLNALTAAHRTLPMPSVVEVTNLENGRRLILRVNDRGPYLHGRIIDVSRRAAQLLGFEAAGTAKVRVRILAPESLQAKAQAERGVVAQPGEAAPPAVPVAAVAVETLPVPQGVKSARGGPNLLPPPRSPPPAATPAPAPPAPVAAALPPVPVRPTNIFVQAGAFADPGNARRLAAKLEPLAHVNRYSHVRVSDATVNGANVYRVRIGPLTVAEADKLLDKLLGAGTVGARIVVD